MCKKDGHKHLIQQCNIFTGDPYENRQIKSATSER